MNSKVMIFYIKKSHVLGRLKQSLNCLSGPIHVQHAPYKLLAFAGSSRFCQCAQKLGSMNY